MVISGSAAITYLLDTHGGNTLHVFALTNFLKNMVLYGCTFFANGMVLDRGIKVSLLILAACQAFCWLLTFPMYRYGKRVRAFVSRRLVFWLFDYWHWWYWDLPPSEFRSRAGSMIVYQSSVWNIPTVPEKQATREFCWSLTVSVEHTHDSDLKPGLYF